MIRRLSTPRFVILGVVVAFAIGYTIFIVVATLYPLTLSVGDIASLTRHGKSVARESASFGFMPAFWVSIGIVAYTIDSARIRRHADNEQ